MKRKGLFVLLACAVLGAAVLHWRHTPIEWLRIGEHSVHIQTGESLQLAAGVGNVQGERFDPYSPPITVYVE